MLGRKPNLTSSRMVVSLQTSFKNELWQRPSFSTFPLTSDFAADILQKTLAGGPHFLKDISPRKQCSHPRPFVLSFSHPHVNISFTWLYVGSPIDHVNSFTS